MPNYRQLQQPKPYYIQHFRITMSMLYTGDLDDIPTYVFYGTEQQLMERVCQRMIQWRSGAFQSLRLSYCQVPRPRNGFAREYHQVEVFGLNTDFMTPKTLAQIFRRALIKETPCRVAFHPFARFINM